MPSPAWSRSRLLVAAAAVAVAVTLPAPSPLSSAGPAATAGSPSGPTIAGSDGSGAAAPPVDRGDPRSDGQGPGFVGEPLAVFVGVLLIGLATATVTALLARLTGRT